MTAQKRRTAKETINELENTIAVMREKLLKLEETVRDAPTKTSARGTQELEPQTVEAMQEFSLDDRLVAVMKVRALHFDEIVAALNEPAGRVVRAFNRLRKAGRVYNLGTEDRPRWHYVIGDDASTAELRDSVERLLTERPMTLAELCTATGCRQNRISGVIVQFDRDMGKPVLNLGNGRRALWFMPRDSDAIIAKLRSTRSRSRST